MQRKLAALIVAVIVSAVPVFAHHAFTAEFDAKKPIKLRGTVAKVELINPHSWLYFDVADKDGKVSRKEVTKVLHKTRVTNSILGVPVAFNFKGDLFKGPKKGVTYFKIQANGTYKQVASS